MTENNESFTNAIDYTKSIPAINAWLESFKDNEEYSRAIQYIYDNFISQESDKKYNAAIDNCILYFSKERPDALQAFDALAASVQVIFNLKAIPHENKKAFAALYRQAMDFRPLYEITPESYRRSTKGWIPYAKKFLLYAMLTEHEFSHPLILKPADLHKIIARTYGDLVSLQSVAQFMRNSGYTKASQTRRAHIGGE